MCKVLETNKNKRASDSVFMISGIIEAKNHYCCLGFLHHHVLHLQMDPLLVMSLCVIKINSTAIVTKQLQSKPTISRCCSFLPSLPVDEDGNCDEQDNA